MAACPPKRRRGAKAETPGNQFPGGHRGRVTPVPIPNTEVKPATADGTACAGVWESRSLPGLFLNAASSNREAAFSLYVHPSERVPAASNARRHQKRSSADVVVSESLERGLDE